MGLLHKIPEKILENAIQDQYTPSGLEMFLRTQPDNAGKKHLLPEKGKFVTIHGNQLQRENINPETRIPYYKLDFNQRHKLKEMADHGSPEREALILEVIEWANRKKIPKKGKELLMELMPPFFQKETAEKMEVSKHALRFLELLPENLKEDILKNNPTIQFLTITGCTDLQKWRDSTIHYFNTTPGMIHSLKFLSEHHGGDSWKGVLSEGTQLDIFDKSGHLFPSWHTPETVEEILRLSRDPQKRHNSFSQKIQAFKLPTWMTQAISKNPDYFKKPEDKKYIETYIARSI